MAHVAKSKSIHDRICVAINNLFKERLDVATDLTEITNAAEEYFRNDIKRNQLFNAAHARSYVPLYGEVSMMYVKVDSLCARLKVTTPFYGPLQISTHVHDLSRVPTVVAAVKAREERYNAVELQRLELTNTFEKAWNSVGSVSALVKLWPAAERLLPSDVLAKLNQEAAPKRTVKAARDAVDVSTLNAKLLMATIAK